METNENYTMNKSDKDRIESVTEKLYQEREKYRGILMEWESYWHDLLGYDLPDNDLTMMFWIKVRPRSVKAINRQFIVNKYPCVLDITYNRGVTLLIDKEAASQTSITCTNKVINVVNNSKNKIEEMQDGYTDPETKMILKSARRLLDDTYYGIIGRVYASSLPESNKSELIGKLKKGLPENID